MKPSPTPQRNTHFRDFVKSGAFGGFVLMAVSLVAFAWANSPWAPSYFALHHLPVEIGAGAWRLEKSLLHVVNDLLMALFFMTGLLVGGVAASAGRLMKKDRRSRRRLQLALNAARMVTWDLDIGSGIVTTSGGAREMFGRGWTSVDDLLASMTDDDARQLRGRYGAALQQGGRFSHTAAITRFSSSSCSTRSN